MIISSHRHDRALEMADRFEVVDGEAKKKLEEPGGIAAMLRY